MQRQTSFEGYGYRTSSRFGSWTTIAVEGDTVSVTGPRIGVLPYRLWIVAQLLVLALVLPAVLVNVVVRDWRYLPLVPGLLVVHWCVGVMGAAGLWEMANLAAIGPGHPMHHFPVTSVKRVKIGPRWARNGLWLVILPYVAGINKMSEGHAVSFEARRGMPPEMRCTPSTCTREKRQRNWRGCSRENDGKTRSRQSGGPAPNTREGQRSVWSRADSRLRFSGPRHTVGSFSMYVRRL